MTRTAIFLSLAAASLPACPAAAAHGPPVEAPRPRAISPRASMRAAYELLAAGDADAAREAILAAIAANPDDAGRAWPEYMPPAGRGVPDSPELDAALAAMPELRELVRGRPDVRDWLSFAFAGFGAEPVFWEDAPPPVPAGAMSGRDAAGRRIVRVRRTDADAGGREVPKPGEELLSSLVFELLNVHNIDSFHELSERARKGRISRDDYVRGYVELEGDTLERTRAFFANVLLCAPYLSALPARERASVWRLFDSDGQRSEMFGAGADRDPDSYPWLPYGYYYDVGRAHELARRGEFAEALGHLGRMPLSERLDPSYRAYALSLEAHCLEGLSRLDAALEPATAAVRLHPSADGFDGRAEILNRLGRRREASDARQRAEMARLRELLVP